MAENSKALEITFGLLEARCLNFSLSDFGLNNKEKFNQADYEFEFKSQVLLDIAEKNVSSHFHTTLFHKRNNIKEPVGTMESVCKFKVVNFDEVVIKQLDDSLAIADHLIAILSGITLSTTRGMMIVKLEDTLYSNVVIPVLDSTIFIPKKDQAIKLT